MKIKVQDIFNMMSMMKGGELFIRSKGCRKKPHSLALFMVSAFHSLSGNGGNISGGFIGTGVKKKKKGQDALVGGFFPRKAGMKGETKNEAELCCQGGGL